MCSFDLHDSKNEKNKFVAPSFCPLRSKELRKLPKLAAKTLCNMA